MTDEAPQQTYERLDTVVKSETRRAEIVNQKLHQATIDIAKEKTQYIEKIALGSGATIAAIVSFVGSHNNKLHPSWLLRSALVSLVLAMMGAMYRNWRYPFYQYNFHTRLDQQAALRLETAKAEFISLFQVNDVETGKMINKDEYLSQYRTDARVIQSNIAGLLRKEEWILNEAKYVEFVALILAAAGITMLVGLAWINF